MNLVLVMTIVGNLTVTSYRSVPNQTDSTPFNTSTGEKVSPDGAAISQDLICNACKKLHKRCKHPENPTKLHYQDWVYIESVGLKRINDLMHQRLTNRMDVWVSSYPKEKQFDKKYRNRKLKVWKLTFTEREATHEQ